MLGSWICRINEGVSYCKFYGLEVDTSLSKCFPRTKCRLDSDDREDAGEIYVTGTAMMAELWSGQQEEEIKQFMEGQVKSTDGWARKIFPQI